MTMTMMMMMVPSKVNPGGGGVVFIVDSEMVVPMPESKHGMYLIPMYMY